MTPEMLARAIAQRNNLNKEKVVQYFSLILDMAQIYGEYAKEGATFKGFIEFFEEAKNATEKI